ncbi:uncharacterized protein TRUGW13939_02241 [Talaromyces rugulosus]|uniref:Uncharacterized protein n=1 Tax=Talaromyces rugulosus TaxID=121627 RepID=A0A7H8QMJ9_TALRU|nr:uncharacterized protein TRUGW13939_02241 [Talaromyces rugulosus]QKX55149.1 hypothetical protein TRUGW13939_02241 [Talaromyces rugulosus]
MGRLLNEVGPILGANDSMDVVEVSGKPPADGVHKVKERSRVVTSERSCQLARYKSCSAPRMGDHFLYDANRSTIDRHVDALVDQLGKSDRRYDVANRCRTSASMEVLQAVISGLDADGIQKSKNYTTSDPRELLVIDLINISPPPSITLDCGQHWRAAVLRMNQRPINSITGLFKKDGFLEDNRSTMWPVEFFYSTEFLDQHPLTCTRLRYNDATAKQSSSFGDDFATIHRVWRHLDSPRKASILSSQKQFVDFLSHLLPGSSAPTSWLPLLKHDSWRLKNHVPQ